MPKLETNFFWTNSVQAGERLTGTYILLGDEPVYVTGIRGPEDLDSPVPSMDYSTVGSKNRQRVRLDDPKLGRFRKLPVLGWVNHEKSRTGVLLERRPVRNRQHGLSDTNTIVGELGLNAAMLGGSNEYVVRWRSREGAYSSIAADPGYVAACKGEYPKLADVITHIRPSTVIAVSPLFAVFRDENGLRWLYRLAHRIGVISGADSLLLLDKYKFMREEVAEDPIITVQNIREF